MDKYDIHVGNTSEITENIIKNSRLSKEEIDRNIANDKLLNLLGVHTALYTDGSIIFPYHPDGIHNYMMDSTLATRLVMDENKTLEELPKNLLERLAYYKSIVDRLMKLKYIDYFGDKYIDSEIFKASLKLFALVGDIGEQLLLMNTNNITILTTDNKIEISNDNKDVVALTENMKKELFSNKNDKYMVIHNHPNGGTFTLYDIIQFLKYPNIRILIAISNDCKQYYIIYKYNTDDNKNFSAYQKISKYVHETGNGSKSFMYILEQLKSNGIIYNSYIIEEE